MLWFFDSRKRLIEEVISEISSLPPGSCMRMWYILIRVNSNEESMLVHLLFIVYLHGMALYVYCYGVLPLAVLRFSLRRQYTGIAILTGWHNALIIVVWLFVISLELVRPLPGRRQVFPPSNAFIEPPKKFSIQDLRLNEKLPLQ